MPELAEVETIVRALASGGRGGPSILGYTIKDASFYWERTLAAPAVEDFQKRISGQRVIGVTRRAKFVVVQLTDDFLIVHLRMSGDLRVEPQWIPEPPVLKPHDRMVLIFTNGGALVFNDPRKFGKAWLVQQTEDLLGGLGPEPFDETLTGSLFYRMLHARSRHLKPLLMDQHFLAGLGNIYTDESLFQARLHPLTPSNALSMEQSSQLLTAIRSVLVEGINRNGASIDWVYRGGDFQNTFKVYQRDGEPCYNCSTIIKRIIVGQRGTHFCPNCQAGSSKI